MSWKETLDLVTQVTEKAFFSGFHQQVLHLADSNLLHTGWVAEGKGRDWENEELCTVAEDQVQVHLSNLKVQRSMESDEMHLQVLREVVDEVAEPL